MKMAQSVEIFTKSKKCSKIICNDWSIDSNDQKMDPKQARNSKRCAAGVEQAFWCAQDMQTSPVYGSKWRCSNEHLSRGIRVFKCLRFKGGVLSEAMAGPGPLMSGMLTLLTMFPAASATLLTVLVAVTLIFQTKPPTWASSFRIKL